MTSASLPSISSDEQLARFVIFERWIRANRSIKQDAFIPPKDLQLSVTRHINLSILELWGIGQCVSDQVAKVRPEVRLLGRADLEVHQVSGVGLKTEAAPLVENPNHAHITGWPDEKSACKSRAQELAAAAKFHGC
jgi:hypothetical protein